MAQNDVLSERMGEKEMRRYFADQPLCLTEPSLAGYVTLTGQSISLPDAYEVTATQPYVFNRTIDAQLAYQTGSVLVVPLQEPSGEVIGVLQLINARDAAGVVVPFDKELEGLVQALASQAAVAIRNTRLEELSFKDPLTGVFNRRYFSRAPGRGVQAAYALRRASVAGPHRPRPLQVDQRRARSPRRRRHPEGSGPGHQRHSRSFSIVTRYGGDEFAVLLVNTPKAGAVKYAQRIKDVIERHPFPHGPLTVSVGVAGMPEDAAASEDLMPAADRALYVAKRLGRNAIEVA